MGINLRELAEKHLETTLEGHYSLPVILIGPDGVVYPEKRAQVLYDTLNQNPETGQLIISNNPIVSLRVSSLERVPIAGENWIFKIPLSPSESAEKVDFAMNKTRAPEGGLTIGFKRYYLIKVKQS